MQRRLWGFGTLVALAFLIALYFAPGHLELDKLVANDRFNRGVMHDGKGAIDTAKSPEARALLERAATNCPANALEGVAAKLELGRI